MAKIVRWSWLARQCSWMMYEVDVVELQPLQTVVDSRRSRETSILRSWADGTVLAQIQLATSRKARILLEANNWRRVPPSNLEIENVAVCGSSNARGLSRA